MLLKKMHNEMLGLIRKLQETKSKVAIYGAADAGMNYVNVLRTYKIPIVCFIDDDIRKQNKKFCGINVLSLETYINTWGGYATILVATYAPCVIIDKLKKQHPLLLQHIKWSDFYLWENELDYSQYYQDNKAQIDKTLELLCDEKSQRVYENMLQYKISRNRGLIEEIRNDVSEQYFTSEIMKFTDKEIFLDLGACSGDTVRRFLDAVNGKYKKIIAVEPNERSFKSLIENTHDFPNIDCYQIGIADKDGIAKFSAQFEYTSNFNEDGDQEIKIKSVDSIMEGAEVTFIKADIEGMEMKMLEGAKETIKKYKPKLAITVYHRKDDIFSIPLLLYSYRNDYKFYMRHYIEISLETVLYAI